MTKPKFQAKVILTIGISNCGKSTFAKELIKENPRYTEVNRDDTRIAFFCDGDRNQYNNYKFSRDKEQLVTKINEACAAFAISRGQGVIVSDTNLNAKTRNFWKNFAKEKGVPYEEQVFDTPLHVCVGRNIKRDITLPKRVLLGQYESYRKFKGIPTYTGTPDKPKAVIFDIDGTVADMEGVRRPFDWHLVGNDKPRQNICEMVRMYRDAGYAIIMMSGRDGVCYKDTCSWLIKNDVPFMHLFMRYPGDKRPDPEVKEEMFWEKVAPHYDVKLTVDDRDRIVDHWRAMGLECIQVAPGAF